MQDTVLHGVSYDANNAARTVRLLLRIIRERGILILRCEHGSLCRWSRHLRRCGGVAAPSHHRILFSAYSLAHKNGACNCKTAFAFCAVLYRKEPNYISPSMRRQQKSFRFVFHPRSQYIYNSERVGMKNYVDYHCINAYNNTASCYVRTAAGLPQCNPGGGPSRTVSAGYPRGAAAHADARNRHQG